MTDLKQQLESMRDRMAEEHFKKTGWAPTEGYVLNYQAGFNTAIPIILEMAQTLHGIKNAKSSGADVYAFADATKFDADEALNKLKQFVDGGK